MMRIADQKAVRRRGNQGSGLNSAGEGTDFRASIEGKVGMPPLMIVRREAQLHKLAGTCCDRVYA